MVLVVLVLFSLALVPAYAQTEAQDQEQEQAQDQTPATAADTIISWLEQNDCSLPFDDVVDRSLSVEGYAPIDIKAAMDDLTGDGSVRRDVNGDFVLVTGERRTGTEVAMPEIPRWLPRRSPGRHPGAERL